MNIGQTLALLHSLGILPSYKKAFFKEQSDSAIVLIESLRAQAGILKGPQSLQGSS